jgi:hypothetical protein
LNTITQPVVFKGAPTSSSSVLLSLARNKPSRGDTNTNSCQVSCLLHFGMNEGTLLSQVAVTQVLQSNFLYDEVGGVAQQSYRCECSDTAASAMTEPGH